MAFRTEITVNIAVLVLLLITSVGFLAQPRVDLKTPAASPSTYILSPSDSLETSVPTFPTASATYAEPSIAQDVTPEPTKRVLAPEPPILPAPLPNPLITFLPTPPPTPVSSSTPILRPTHLPQQSQRPILEEEGQAFSGIVVSSPTDGPTASRSQDLQLGIYKSDPANALSQLLTSIDWSAESSLAPGQSRSSPVVYFRNEGNVPFSMGLEAVDWVLRDSQGTSLGAEYQKYFTLSWNYDNTKMMINQTTPVILSLEISSEIVDVVLFSFKISIKLTA